MLGWAPETRCQTALIRDQGDKLNAPLCCNSSALIKGERQLVWALVEPWLSRVVSPTVSLSTKCEGSIVGKGTAKSTLPRPPTDPVSRHREVLSDKDHSLHCTATSISCWLMNDKGQCRIPQSQEHQRDAKLCLLAWVFKHCQDGGLITQRNF